VQNLLTFIVGTLLIAAPVMNAQDETKRMSENPSHAIQGHGGQILSFQLQTALRIGTPWASRRVP